MKINVVFLTADRSELTKKTVNTFLKFNDISNFKLIYGDDGSIDDTHEFMESVGIECLFRHTGRVGCSESSEELIQKTEEKYPSDLTLYIQNDWETIRPLPMETIERLFEDDGIGWVRLFGKEKNPGSPVGSGHNGKPGKPIVDWRPLQIFDEKLEVSDIHWCYGPCITRSSLLTKIVKDVGREAHCIANAMDLSKLTARFLKNVVNHIGVHQSTPRGRFGKEGGSYHRQAKK